MTERRRFEHRTGLYYHEDRILQHKQYITHIRMILSRSSLSSFLVPLSPLLTSRVKRCSQQSCDVSAAVGYQPPTS